MESRRGCRRFQFEYGGKDGIEKEFTDKQSEKKEYHKLTCSWKKIANQYLEFYRLDFSLKLED